MNITTKSEADRKALSFAMNLSLVIGLLMFVMKMGAYFLTGSAAAAPHWFQRRRQVKASVPELTLSTY